MGHWDKFPSCSHFPSAIYSDRFFFLNSLHQYKFAQLFFNTSVHFSHYAAHSYRIHQSTSRFVLNAKILTTFKEDFKRFTAGSHPFLILFPSTPLPPPPPSLRHVLPRPPVPSFGQIETTRVRPYSGATAETVKSMATAQAAGRKQSNDRRPMVMVCLIAHANRQIITATS